jgi:UDP:flavonoid glycosyltransferase YjiC (YdhE family)
LQPQEPTRRGDAGTNPLLPRGNSLLNLWMGQFAERLVWSIGATTVNALRTQQLGLPAHTPRSYLAAKHTTPIVYGFSRLVVPRPADWPARVVISGYWFLDEGQAWQPPADLQAFLEAGPPPVYIGFGSMSHRDPQATLRLIVDALQPARQRAVLAAGWSGVRGEQLPDHLFALQSAPHDWLLPRMAGIVHHGGAGTTAAGLRAGKPTLIIPHMSDQPYWGRRVHELGVGPSPIPRHKLTAAALARGIAALVNDPTQTQRAAALGQAICAEDGIAAAVATIDRLAQPSVLRQSTHAPFQSF